MATELTELQRDALTELVNIAISGAAVRLRGMVGSEVTLTVPAVALVDAGEAVAAMESLGLKSLVAARQGFGGALAGETFLLFPQGNSQELLRLILTDPPDAENADLHDDALREIGNVLLTGFLSMIGKMIRRDFDVGLPSISEGEPSHLFQDRPEGVVIFIYVNFGIRGRSVTGYFAMLLELASMAALQQIVDDVILQAGG